jgi:two-component system OmpR family response regulator
VPKKRILFVDNRPEFMHQPVLRLRLEGYEVEECTTGEEGVARLREQDYDLLMLDAELPDSDGWGTIKAVRQDPSLADTKIIVFMAPQGETGKLVLVPVEGELRRPFNMAQMLEAVERVIGAP